MSTPPTFLADLTPEAELITTVALRPVIGADLIRRLVAAVAATYTSKTPACRGTVGGREIVTYTATFGVEQSVQAIVALTRNAAGKVSHVAICYAPLTPAMALSRAIGLQIAGDFPPDTFL
jgi:hypothetical protein